jgi:hypothetical protein
MSTVNLGQIKPVFKGSYNNSTAYVLDNIVTSAGSSYICILASTGNAVSNGTYWTQMSAAGTNGTNGSNGSNGTDVGTVITTAGDILYRDGSGPQRLAKGTAGQALVMNSGATAPEWGAGVDGYQLMEWQRKKQSTTFSTSSTSQNNLVIAGALYLTVNVKATTDIVEVGLRMNIRFDNMAYSGYGFESDDNAGFTSPANQWSTGQHAEGSEWGDIGQANKYLSVSAVVGYTAADWGFAANTQYFIRPIGMTHSSPSTFTFGGSTTSGTDTGIHFYLKRWEVQ